MFAKILSLALAIALMLCACALADSARDLTQFPSNYPYTPKEEPMVVVNCEQWISVWADTQKSERLGILPLGSIIDFWAPYSDEFIYFDMVGNGGYVSCDYVKPLFEDLVTDRPLYVANCQEWISVWNRPSNAFGSMATLTLGTCIDEWAPYNDQYICIKLGSYTGFVAWEYLSENP